MKPFEFLEHPADIKFVARGACLEAMLKSAALAFCATITEDDPTGSVLQRTLTFTASSDTELLYMFLQQLVVLADIDDFVCFSALSITLQMEDGNFMCQAQLSGKSMTEVHFLREIKSVTRHQLSVKEIGDHLEGTAVFDV